MTIIPAPRDPNHDVAFLLARAERQRAAGRWAAAARLLDRVVAHAPDRGDAHATLGDCRQALHHWADAIAGYDRAIALDPADGSLHRRRARALLKAGELPAALAAALRATTLAPGDAAGWTTLGRIFGKLEQYPLALRAYRRAAAIAPDHPFLKGRILQQQVLACNWTGLAERIAEIEADLDAGKPSARPFVWQAVATSVRSLALCAAAFAPPATTPTRRPAMPRSDRRIRLGYLSGELRDHSTAYLRAGMFEHHDKSRFTVTGFDNGWDDGGRTRARINAALDRIVPIAELDDRAAAAAIAAAGIDVLVDLNGFNGRNRLGVLARRPAPVQATFPGYPGTLGVDYLDYIVADAVVVPPEHRAYYAEAAALLPDCYQANDRSKAIADRAFTRAELGLPDAGFVFCCFNGAYKIMPATFAAWVRILHAVPGSVLWLLAGNVHVIANLRAAAAARGLDPTRLVFAGRMTLAEHLARHRAADLFLDTLPCNAHTTASDALWAGLPVLTCLGDTFSGRVAASVLNAVGLPDLVAPTLTDYAAMAIALATDPGALDRVRARLDANRLTMPLFDTARHTCHIERAFTIMHERRIAGLAPADFAVEPLA